MHTLIPRCLRSLVIFTLVHKSSLSFYLGDYHEIQCDSERCYCAEPLHGWPLPGSLVPVGRRPSCARQRPCSSLDCASNEQCEHGFKFDENGCPTCECKNACAAIDCHEGAVCTMIPVECAGGECKHQPRCGFLESLSCYGKNRLTSIM